MMIIMPIANGGNGHETDDGNVMSVVMMIVIMMMAMLPLLLRLQ